MISIPVAVPIVVGIVISIAVLVSVPVSIPVVVAVGYAAKLPIDIFDDAVTAREGFKRSVYPDTISILAVSAQYSIANTNIPASLGVTAGWQRAILFANQVAVSIRNVAPAAVCGIEHSIMVTTAIVFTTRA
ncbi:MAG TPA: hypothetical protein VIK39_10030 [Candidatus Angelobacter sp.]